MAMRRFRPVFAINDELQQRLPQADYVVLITPLTEQTRGLFGAARICRNEFRGARFINIGRGRAGRVEPMRCSMRCMKERIAGAALDVFVEEPLPPSTARSGRAPNCLVSPHMSGDYAEFEAAMADQFIDNWRALPP